MKSKTADSQFGVAGYSLPYGAQLTQGGVEFSFASKTATGARVLLYSSPSDTEPDRVISLDMERDRLGHVWRTFVPNLEEGALYHFQLDGPFAPEQGLYFDSRTPLIDPYARALAGDFLPKQDGVCRPPKCVVVSDAFDWEGDRPIRRSFADEIIYELHVRGFTQSPTSGVKKRGSYLGLIEKIPYLQKLGVTAVELMPVHEFPRNTPSGEWKQPANYWGYDPIVFCAPHRGYAWDETPGAQVREFKEMIKAFHRAGLEVYLDVVLNHTAEGDTRGETFSLKGFESKHYYMMRSDGSFLNYSGCGNTVNGNHPWTRELIFSCLRSWVCNYHIDGFRFDLASILSRDRNGNLVWNPPIIETISEDPILAETKVIAEAWDAAGAYQVGSFASVRWAEWNGRYRDDARRFWRGDDWSRGSFATRLCGSSDLYKGRGRKPTCSVNFITAHDGFTLNDLTSYNYKHNEANGEDNRDGENSNISYNFGVEGDTKDARINELRARQVKNFLGSLLLSQGVPMLLMGDEARRTQYGNNNAYCQDNELSWFDWERMEQNVDLVRFVSAFIKLRRREASLRRRDFFTGEPQTPGSMPDVVWFDQRGGRVDWNAAQPPAFTCLISAIDPKIDPGFIEEFKRASSLVSAEMPFDLIDEVVPSSSLHIVVFFNASPHSQTFYFPALLKRSDLLWTLFADTASEAPCDVYPEFNGPSPCVDQPQCVAEHSMKVFVARV